MKRSENKAQNKSQDQARAAAAIELADALNAEFRDPRSALKGIGRDTMEKLLVYHKLAEKAELMQAKRLMKAAQAEQPDDTES
jgi:DNA polymerase/3'-5' exonuclease PolX